MDMRRATALVLMGFMSTLFSQSANAMEVVFGNLGSDGNGSIGTLNMDIGTGLIDDANWVAEGFNTGTSSFLTITSVTLGIWGTSSGTVPITVSIYEGTGAPTEPDASPLYTSDVTNVGLQNRYQFNFTGGAVLLPSTSYFILANTGSWYYNANTLPAEPTGQNSSGYTFVSTLQSNYTGTTPAGPWITSESTRFSVSITAVPEPSTFALGTICVMAACFISKRRARRLV